jgi:hypothetical protein
MRNRHPEAFKRIIKAQTQLISKNNVVVINNVGFDAMHYLSDRITAIDGVLSLLPCKSVNEDGKYKVLVHQKNYHRVRQHLKDVIPRWYEDMLNLMRKPQKEDIQVNLRFHRPTPMDTLKVTTRI